MSGFRERNPGITKRYSKLQVLDSHPGIELIVTKMWSKYFSLKFSQIYPKVYKMFWVKIKLRLGSFENALTRRYELGSVRSGRLSQCPWSASTARTSIPPSFFFFFNFRKSDPEPDKFVYLEKWIPGSRRKDWKHNLKGMDNLMTDSRWSMMHFTSGLV